MLARPIKIILVRRILTYPTSFGVGEHALKLVTEIGRHLAADTSRLKVHHMSRVFDKECHRQPFVTS